MSPRPRIVWSLAAALAAAAPALANAQSSTTKTLHVKAGFSPNPIVIRDIDPGAKKVPHRKLGTTSSSSCSGYTTATPMLTLKLDKPMSSDLVLRAHGGDLKNILVFFPGNRFICKDTRVIGPIELRMKEWPAGELKVYLTGWNSTRPYKYTIEVEDTSRGETYDKSIPTRTLSKNPAKPILISGKVRSDIGPPSYKLKRAAWDCRGAQWSRQPDLFLELDRPLKDMTVRLMWPKDKLRLRLLKLPSDNKRPRNIFGACKNDGTLGYRTMDDGKYAVFVGGAAATKGQAYNLVITGKDTVTDPLALAPSIPAKLPLPQRSVWNHFPFLTRDSWRRGHKRDLLEHALFMKAPKQLFAYIKFDMDEASARPVFYPGNKEKVPYPKANEPVLVINANRDSATVMTADGDQYRIKQKYLLDAPRGQVALPKAARRTDTSYSVARDYAAPADKRHLARHSRLLERINKCIDRRWEPYQRQIDALRRGPWSKHRAMRIEAVKRRGDRAVDRGCRPQRKRASEKKLRAILIKTRTKRRNKALAQIRRRFGAE